MHLAHATANPSWDRCQLLPATTARTSLPLGPRQHNPPLKVPARAWYAASPATEDLGIIYGLLEEGVGAHLVSVRVRRDGRVVDRVRVGGRRRAARKAVRARVVAGVRRAERCTENVQIQLTTIVEQ